ncbi:MAG: elongator complex protein 3 [Desulfopila sp.]
MSLVIPLFIPHRGCPHRCLFCNQRAIAGPSAGPLSDEAIAGQINAWLSRSRLQSAAQVAFYGGSFTCLDPGEQRRLLSAVAPFLGDGRVKEIRLSTRPDCVSEANSRLLAAMGVRTVELGVQSLDERVLVRARRGHSAADSRRAMRILRQAGLQVGVQLLPGLPGETTASFLAGVREIVDFHPDLVRLYPTVVVADSALAALYREGRYRPLTLNRAIAITRRARELLMAAAIPVVRMGLQPTTELSRQVVAGPYHPAFGELVVSRQWLVDIRRRLEALGVDSHLRIYISHRDHSAVVGVRKMNIRRLAQLGFAGRFSIIPEQQRERGSVRYVVC